jgi:hypothetical protein
MVSLTQIFAEAPGQLELLGGLSLHTAAAGKWFRQPFCLPT